MKSKLWLTAVFSTLLCAVTWAQNAPTTNSTTIPAQQYFAEAQKLAREGKADDARAAFAKGIELDPFNQAAVMAQAGTFMGLNRPDDALKVWDKWIELKPDDPQRWLYKCVAAGESGRGEEALKAADKLTQLQPDKADGWKAKGQCLAGMNRNEEALQAADRAITLDPMDEDSWRIRIAIEPNLKEFDSSLTFVSKLVGKYPKCLGAVYDRAGLDALKGDKAKALADLKSALAIRSDDVKPFALQDERFKSLRNDPDFQKLTGSGVEGSPVFVSPAAPAAGKSVTIQYVAAGRNLASASQVYIHLGWNNWNPVVSPDPAMTFNPASNSWEYTVTVPSNATNLNCVFNNGSGTWDNNNTAN